jgi:release factor glutamine methyltransferase
MRVPSHTDLGTPRLDSRRRWVRAAREGSGWLVQRVVRPGARTRWAMVGGHRLEVAPQVFDPVLFRSGRLLAEVVRERVRPGERVLEVGTGSGASALMAGLAGAQVLAVDINPHAVACAQRNAERLGLAEHVEVRLGDVYEGVQGPFDRVVSNPPFYGGAPSSALDHAWRGDGVLERLVDGLGDMLAPDGEALLLLSTEGRCTLLLDTLVQRGWATELLASKTLLSEHMGVYAVRR